MCWGSSKSTSHPKTMMWIETLMSRTYVFSVFILTLIFAFFFNKEMYPVLPEHSILPELWPRNDAVYDCRIAADRPLFLSAVVLMKVACGVPSSPLRTKHTLYCYWKIQWSHSLFHGLFDKILTCNPEATAHLDFGRTKSCMFVNKSIRF